MTDKPTLALNNAAALRLAQLIATSGLLTAPDAVTSVGNFAEAHLCELKPAPDRPAEEAKPEEWRAWEKGFMTWGREPVAPIETSIRRRDALKALLKSASEKGMLSGQAGDTKLLRIFELGSDD